MLSAYFKVSQKTSNCPNKLINEENRHLPDLCRETGKYRSYRSVRYPFTNPINFIIGN